MTNKILPIAEPIIRCYPFYGTTFSILCNETKTYPWIFDNYINLIYINQLNRGTILESSNDHLEFCPFLKMQVIDYNLVNKSWDNIINFLIDNVDLNKYVRIYLDEYYLPCCLYYQQELRRETFTTMIFGYDLKKSCFYTRSYYENMKYMDKEILFTDLEKAYLSCNHLHPELEFFTFELKPDEEYNCKDSSRIKNSLIDYLECKDSNGWYFYKQHMPVVQSYTYGISYYDHIITNCSKASNSNVTLYILYDHKVLMEQRLKYMKERDWIHNFEKLNQMCIALKGLANVGVNLALKYNVSSNNSILEKMREHYIKMKELDTKFTSELINSIIL